MSLASLHNFDFVLKLEKPEQSCAGPGIAICSLVPRTRTPQAASLQLCAGCRDLLPAGGSLQLEKRRLGNRTGTCRSQRCWPGDLLARAIQPKISQCIGNVHEMTHSP